MASGAGAEALCAAASEDEWLPWPAPEAGSFDVEADEADLSVEDVAILRGDVVVRDVGQELRADEVRYLRRLERVDATGDVRYRNRELSLSAESAQVRLESEEGQLDSVSYRLREGGGRGSAERMRLAGQDRAVLEELLYTTCRLPRPDWSIGARKMTLDLQRGVGTARGMRLKVGRATVLALPYATFPLDDRRKSGLLFPRIGTSNDNGLDLAQPYYWNIAPDRDATITPRWISDRGAMLGAEYRYLGRSHAGEISGAYLPEDDLLDRHRGIGSWRHIQRLTDSLDFDLDANYVSDRAYFEDFGDSLTVTSQAFLRSVARLRAHGGWWDAVLMADNYQTLDRAVPEEGEPYNRLPRALLSARLPMAGGFEVALRAEAAYFERDLGDEGARVDLYPTLARPLLRPAYHLVPEIGVRYTTYDLERSADGSPSRTTPIASVRGGLHFERRTATGRLHTLEPRFHYLYVPFEAQDDLPTFDAAELTFSFDQLFRTNRFTGADRQADANQLGLGVTTRLFDDSGVRQVLEASAGTIVYFDDQRVQLPGQPERSDDSAPLVAELQYRPSDLWRGAFGFQYDPEDGEFDQALVAVEATLPSATAVNLAYRQRTDLVRQVDASLFLPVSDRWTLVGRVNYSLLDDTDLETLVGAEYDSCCWAVRAFARRYLRNQRGEKRTGLFVEFELKGLGSLGRGPTDLLEQGIAGSAMRGSL